MRFPPTLTDPAASQAEVLAALRAFATNLRDDKLGSYLEFHPTYVRLELDDDGRLLAGELAEYDWQRDRLAWCVPNPGTGDGPAWSAKRTVISGYRTRPPGADEPRAPTDSYAHRLRAIELATPADAPTTSRGCSTR